MTGDGHALFRYATIASALLCYTTILLGGTVMAGGDGLACPHWPTCYPNGALFPSVTGGAAVEWSHRVSAFVLAASVVLLAVLGIAYERSRPILLTLGLAALGLVIGEALLGGWVVGSDLVVVLVLVHLAIATLLFGLLLVLLLLAHLGHLPSRWVAWARRATEERAPSAAPETRAPSSLPDRGNVGRPAQG